MPEWLVERGIGETRAALVGHGRIIEARIEIDGGVPSGTVLPGRLTSIGENGRNGIAADSRGREYLLPQSLREVTEGAEILIEVMRDAIPGVEPWKRPLARLATHGPTRPRSIAERLRASGVQVREIAFPSPRDELEAAGWGEVMEQAASGEAAFAGGNLRMFVTPAMTLIDVDGSLSPADLAEAGAAEAARAIRRLDIGGSIGIDLPTTQGKAPRLAAAAAIDEHLPQPFERTAVNGFGFVQIVRPRRRPSLLEVWADRPAAEARALLRRTASERHGPTTLVASATVAQVLESRPDWLDALSRHIGGAVSLRSEPSLPIHGSYAQAS